MGEEKRKREREVSEADKALKSPRLAVAGKSLKSPGLDLLAAVAFPSVSTRGRCHHMSVDMAVYDINNSEELPTCHYPGCGITWKGAGEDKAGMMRCIECHIVSCARGVDRPDPRGHALWHARNCKHYGAQWYDEPNLGYCFKCGLVMRLRDNQWSEDECAEVDNEVTDAVDQWGMVAGNSADGHASGNGYVIRGMPNHGNTCYMNASLQCLLALGKMRTMILSPDVRLGDIGLDLKQLFVETSSANNATHMLDPRMILVYMESLYQDQERFKIPKMEDSHEFLTSLRDALDNEVVQLNNSHVMQGGEVFPTFGQSIFRGQLNQTVSCKRCSNNSVTDHSFDGLQLAVPSKDHSARSNPLQVDSCEVKDVVHGHLQTQKNDVAREIVDVQVKYLDFIPSLFDDCEEMEESSADSYNPEDKGKARGSNSLGSIEDCLTLHFHGLTICKNCPKVAELPETNESKNVEPIMASTNANTTVDEDQTELSDRKTFPNERSTDFNSFLVVSSSRQPYPSDSHHEVTLSDDITTEEITSGKSCGEKDLASCSTAKEKAESRREGVQKAGPSCLPTDKQTDLLSAPDIQDTSTQKQGKGKHVLDDHSAQQVEETHNEQTDGNGSAVQTQLISKLPPVLTIQLKRYAPDLSKLRGHVSFKEILRLGPFMYPSSEDKDNSRYRLVGVIEHFGNTLNSGHYIAYVRGSGSSWVRASDRDIEVVSLEKVLRCEAYILFYERIED